MIVIPVQVVTGFFYLYYMYPDSNLNEWGLEVFAIIHTLGAFALLAFVIAHVYLTTTGDTIFSSIQAMITGWEVVHIDEEEAREKHLMNAVNDSVAGYYRIDLYGTITDVNDAWLEIYGYNSRDDVVGKHYSFARDEKNRAELESVVERVMGGAKITSLPVTRKGADGKPGRHLLSANPVIEDGKIGGMEGFILDITETEDEMEHMYYAVRNSGAGYYRLDSDLRLVDVNDAWLKLYKYERKEDVLGRHFSITRESSDLDNSKTIFDKVLKGETISGKLVTRRCSDDSTGKHLLSASPFHVGNNIKGVEGFILDITHLYKD
ncbi:MAG: PAS domain S-box protein, partial [Bacteroidota bacterium]